MSRPALVLVPPSLGKAEGGRRRFSPRSGAFRRLAPQRIEVIDAVSSVAHADPDQASKVFGATGDLLERAIAAATAVGDGAAPVLAATERYTGVVWDHLDPATLDDAARAQLVVPSALVGLSLGTDPVPDHRLGFSTSLPGIGRLDRWWRPVLTDALLRRADGAPVVDLLPNEHAAALDLDAVADSTQLVRVRFVSADGAKAVGHAAKAVKGIVARRVLTHGVDGLPGLRWEGWRVRRGEGCLEVVAPA
ncbi:MAG: peroxide stress protein YaaA [Acidimicrobiales bacterium]